MLEVHYLCSFENNEDTYVLRCGKNVSQYFSKYNFWVDSLSLSGIESLKIVINDNRERLNGAFYGNKPLPYCPGHREYLYRNLENGIISIYTDIRSGKYRVNDSIPVFNWVVYEDSIASLLGYTCVLAKTYFRGREWSVWFTYDIPISIGPWKFGGLPGIILKADCTGFVILEAKRILTNNLSPIRFYNFSNRKKYKDLDRHTYLKLKMDSTPYPKGTVMSPQLELE